MRSARLAFVVALTVLGLLVGVGGVRAATPPVTVPPFTFTDDFFVNPGDPASCPFTTHVVVVVQRTFQVFFDSLGQPSSLMLHDHWTGTVSANGKSDIEHGSQQTMIDLVTGTLKSTCQIHDQFPLGGGVVVKNSGIVIVDANGNVTFIAGQQQGLEGDVGELCASLS
jgi:hypothetical protein